MSPEYVRPHVKAQKNDDRDAEAIAEAASRPTMRFVELKSEAQLDIQNTAPGSLPPCGRQKPLLNQLRALLLERGCIFPQGRRKLEQALETLMDDPALTVSPRMRQLVADMRAEWQNLDKRIAILNTEFVDLVRSTATARRLITVPGIGVLNATALVAAVGDASAFRRSRNLAAWLGLVPRQCTTGGKPKLLGITKRGNKYLRMLFIYGARAAMPTLAKSASPLGAWLRELLARTHRNIAFAALANKLARIAWAMLRGEEGFALKHGAAAG